VKAYTVILEYSPDMEIIIKRSSDSPGKAVDEAIEAIRISKGRLHTVTVEGIDEDV